VNSVKQDFVALLGHSARKQSGPGSCNRGFPGVARKKLEI